MAKNTYKEYKKHPNRNYDPHSDQRLKRSYIEKPSTGLAGKIMSVVLSFGIAYIINVVYKAIRLPIVNFNSLRTVKGLTLSKLYKWYATRHPGGVWGFPASIYQWMAFVVIFVLFFALFYELFKHNTDIENQDKDLSDINQHEDDDHLMFPEEMNTFFNVFPDRGAHSSVQVSGIISHRALSNKGIKPRRIAQHQSSKEPMLDADGDVIYYPGEVYRDDNGKPVRKTMPFIDTEYGKDVITASVRSSEPDAPDAANDVLMNADETPYNPGGKNRDKAKYETVADLINNDWQLPYYETQRPTGVYYVSSDPINTLCVAITRAGKGQTIIEPTLDMWTREKRPNNALINDPKGENARRFYAPCTIRGIDPILINLMVPMKTDIYNPIYLAVQYARKGNFKDCSAIVTAIADVFFPKDGGEDPVWPAAASNAFQRAVYGLIDYYLEKERNIRAQARKEKWTEAKLSRYLDKEWGHVTPYNCYEFFVSMTSKKLPNPTAKIKALDEAHANKADNLTDAEFQQYRNHLITEGEIWGNKPEADELELFFNATERLPQNESRTLANNANNALKGMGVAEKMLGSVYGIAITGMSYFTDPTVRTLTSGTPSQNVNLESLSFPRHLSARFDPEYLQDNHYIGANVVWDAYTDDTFKEKLEGDFHHENIIQQDGWAHYYFDGKFKKDDAYLKLSLYSSETKRKLKTFYFHFRKGYQMSLDYKRYTTNPITGKKIVHDGTLQEIRLDKKTGRYRNFTSTFRAKRGMDDLENQIEIMKPVFMMTDAQYTEHPKFIFVITPPHLMQYAKLILILIKQLTDLNFGQSYTTMENQKPLYKTRYMLDELGNLQSEGKGIMNFETLLSIGLGQDQQFSATSCIVKSCAA